LDELRHTYGLLNLISNDRQSEYYNIKEKILNAKITKNPKTKKSSKQTPHIRHKPLTTDPQTTVQTITDKING
jgi:hypothetical protein